VILNASYGVFGAASFDLYCPPVAEATAAIGRHSITQILNRAEGLGIQVLYGDTDSLFLKNPSKEQIEELARWTERKSLQIRGFQLPQKELPRRSGRRHSRRQRVNGQEKAHTNIHQKRL
jgi:DNA polymerase elongation subunit (family B)